MFVCLAKQHPGQGQVKQEKSREKFHPTSYKHLFLALYARGGGANRDKNLSIKSDGNIVISI